MSEKTFKFLSRFSLYISGLAIAFGVMVLTGWILHIQRLKGLIPGQVSVKANTAVCFLLIGTALWLAILETRKRPTIVLSRVLALMASLIGLLSFLEFWKGWDFGIDQLLFRAGPDDLPGSVRIGLMSPIAAVDFLLLGIAIALLNFRGRWSLVLQNVCAAVAAVAAVFGLLDFVLDPQHTHTHIAPLTAAVLFSCSFAMLSARLEGGLGALLVSETAGGMLCRRLLPSAILIPIAIAWLRWKGQQIGLFSDWTGVAIMTLSSGVLLAGLTVWTAIVLDRIEVRRERAEESSRRLGAIVTSSNDAIIGETLDGIATSWNPGAEAIYGYSAEEMIGQPVTRLVSAERLEEFKGFLQRLRNGENVRHYETERIRKDGKAISVAVSISPLKDASGKIVGASTIARDISDQQRAEQALASERRRFEAVLDSLPVMICLLRPDYSVAFANRSFRKQFGEPQGRKCYEFCFDQTAPCEFCHSFDVLKNGQPTDWQVVTRDGRIIHAFDFPFTDSDGSPLVLEMDVDVTEQKAAERQLQEASRYTRSLLEASLDPLVTISKEGKITDVNEATERATGLSREGLIGSDFSSYFTEPEKARDSYQRVFEKGFVRDYPLAIRSTSGAVTDVLYNATVFKGANGEVEGVFAAARDVTERKRAEENLRKASLYARSLLEASLDPLVTISKEGKITDVNQATEKATGLSREGLIGSDFCDYFTEPDKARDSYQRVFEKGFVRDYPLAIRSSSGAVAHVLYNATVFKDPNGRVEGVFAAARDVTERKRAEEALQLERQRFRDVLDKLPAYVVLLTPDYHVALDNTEFRKRFGESKGRPCYEFLFHRDSPCEICETYSVLKTGAPRQWKWTGPDGRHYDISDFPFPDADGSPLILEMGLDVTEREKAETALRESEQKFSTLADLVPQFVWMCTSDGMNFYFNQRWFDYTGLSKEESYGKGWNTPFHPDDKQAAWNAWNHATATGETYRVESRLRAADGSYRWFLMRGSPTRDDSGNIVRWFGTCTDIDDMKGAQQQLRLLNEELENRVQQRTAELQASEQSVRRKLDSILLPEGDLGKLELGDILDVPTIQTLLEDFHSVVHVTTALIDLNGKIVAVAGWQKICNEFHRINVESCKNCIESDKQLSTGIPEGEFKIYKCKNHMWDVATPIMVSGQHLGNLFCGQFFFDDEVIDYDVFRAQAKHYSFDEREYLAALDAVPHLSREAVNASMAFLARLARMISQFSYSTIKLARSTEQAHRANLELTAANKELEAFTYSVSHDLRAPLRHISGFSNILAEEFAETLPPEAQHHVQRIAEGTRRMGQLVDDLLNLGRVGRKELSLQVAGIRSIVCDVIEGLKPDAGDRQVEWKIGDLPYVECDPSLMRQVFQNLLANALKFTRPRSQAVIEIGQQQRDGTSVVYVRDNGVGFSMKYADKLFGVFQRLHRAEDFEGTGVGLATVHRIIQKHGGRIWAEAELDKGASFYFTLGNSPGAEENSKAVDAGVSS